MEQSVFKLDRERIVEIGKLMRKNSRLVDEVEDKDTQYTVVKNIIDIMGDPIESAIVILGVALVSYMLSVKGEQHWLMLKDYVSRHKHKNVEEILHGFVSKSASLGRFRSARLRRIKRYLRNVAPLIKEKFNEYALNLRLFHDDLVIALKCRREAKTIVFTVKMFYYILKALGFKASLPFSVSLPIDYRVCRLSLTSGIIFSEGLNTRSAVNLLRGRYSNIVRDAWNQISNIAELPPLKIDNFIWTVGGLKDSEESDKIFSALEKMLSRKLTHDERALMIELFKYSHI